MLKQTTSTTLYLLLLSLLILPIRTSIIAQSKVIKGKISTKKGAVLDAVTIITPRGDGAISNSNGQFTLVLKERNTIQQLNIRRLGYQTIDTLISLTDRDTTELKIIMQEKIFEQAAVEVRANRLNIFQKNNWLVLDYAIMGDQFLFLYKVKRKRKLGLFDSEGFLIYEQNILEPYSDIKVSCTNTILLNGRWESAEYHILDKQLHLLKYHTKEEYDKLLKPCIAKVNEELFFKDFTDHNKKVYYYTFPSPRTPKLILSISDSIAAEVAASYYQEILIAYTNAVRRNYSPFRKNHRDYLPGDDVTTQHLINDGLWDGDLKKLMVDPITVDLVPQYLLLESKPIQTGEFIQNDSLYLMDYANKKLVCINTLDKTFTSSELENFNWKGENIVITDESKNSNYLLNTDKFGNHTLHQFILGTNQDRLTKLTSLNIEGDKQNRILIHKERLYYLAKYSQRNTKFKWIELDRLNRN